MYLFMLICIVNDLFFGDLNQCTQDGFNIYFFITDIINKTVFVKFQKRKKTLKNNQL